MINYLLKSELFNANKAVMGQMCSLARENLKESQKMYNFALGHPSPEFFSDKLIQKYIIQVMDENPKQILQYGSHLGYEPLRNLLKDYLGKSGNYCNINDDIMITYGATEAIYLAATAFINHGDKVAIDEPGYVNAIKAIRILGGNVQGIPMEADGVNLKELERAFMDGAKFYYTVPNYANPSGITMSLEKRKEVYRLALKYNVPIIEDDAYGSLRYEGERISSIKELDDEGIVVYIGTMSKIIAPGMRIGYMVANGDLLKKIVSIKAVSSNGVTNITQCAMYKLMLENDLHVIINNICMEYRNRMIRMEEAIKKYCHAEIKCSHPTGGMFLWVTLPEGHDARVFCQTLALRYHVAVTPGNGFYTDENKICRDMRFNCVSENINDITNGIRLVGELTHEYIKSGGNGNA